jgi:signal peptidase I
VEVRGRAVLINGTALSEPYAHFLFTDDEEGGAAEGLRAWGPKTVPAGNYFVLGDNRDNSRDSRFWGFLPKGLVLGRPALIYFSREMSREDPPLKPTPIRWDRIGRRIQ